MVALVKGLQLLLSLLHVSSIRQWLTYNQSQDTFVEKAFPLADLGPVFNKTRGVEVEEGAGRHALRVAIPPVSSDSNTWVYASQVGQDRLVLEILEQKRNGFYLEIGSRYWMRNSNTFALDVYFDWRGVCVEPDKKFSRGLVINRTCVVITDNPVTEQPGQKVRFNYFVNPGRSKNVGNEDEVKITITLEQLCTHIKDIPTVIDYISLDVEGHEMHVLSRFPFHTHTFLVASIERPTQSVHNLLVKKGYFFLTALGNFGEAVYVNGDVPAFRTLMRKYRLGKDTMTVRDDMRFVLNPAYRDG